MSFLVTGASGFLGSYLTKRLVEHGNDVSILVRKESDLWRLADVIDRVRIFHASLDDIETARSAIAEFRPETVFHLAWNGVTEEFRNDPEQVTSNVTGGLKLFEIAREHGCRCWIGVGSQAEYGPYSGLLQEDFPTRPQSVYGVSKLCLGLLTEKLCGLAGIRFVWLRLLASYGPTDDARHLIPSVINHLLRGEKPALTPGEQKWDYLYVDDAVRAIHLAGVTSGMSGIYNMGSGETHTVRRIVERIREIIDPSLPLGIGEIAYRPNEVMHLQADITKLQAAIPWRPETTLDEGLKRTVAWYRANA